MKKVMLFFIAAICLTTFIGCEKDKDVELPLTLKSTSTTLTSSQTFNITVTPDTVGCTYESENDLIASVSTNGLITAKRVGETNIVVKNNKKNFTSKFKVTVTPKYSMYKEPYLVFGSTKAAIKNYEKRSLMEEAETYINYYGENSTTSGILYSFSNSTYEVSACLIPTSYSSLLSSFMAERYVYMGRSGDYLVSVTTDYKATVTAYVYSTSYWMVMYSNNTTFKKGAKSNTNLSNFIKIANSIKTNTKMLSKEK